MRLEIRHSTRYTYSRAVLLQSHLFYLRPRAHAGLEVEDFTLVTRPHADLQWMRDDFDNLAAVADFRQETDFLEIDSSCVVLTDDSPPLAYLVRDYATTIPFAYESLHRSNLAAYLAAPDESTARQLNHWIETSLVYPPSDTVGWIFSLNRQIARSFVYRRRDAAGIQTPLATLSAGSGSCRDLAQFLIACLRVRGLAARFVSGYCHDPAAPAGSPLSMHAWAEVFLPGAGWKGLDPTQGIFAHATHVSVAHAAVAESVNPIQGAFLSAVPATAQLTTQVTMQRIASDPSGLRRAS